MTIPDAATTGFTLDPSTVLDLAAEFAFNDAALATTLGTASLTGKVAFVIDPLRQPLATGNLSQFQFYVNVIAVNSAVEAALTATPNLALTLPYDFDAGSWGYFGDDVVRGGTAAGDEVRVRRLSPMQRPLLLRAWVEAALGLGLLERNDPVDALHLACQALQVPVPETLQRQAPAAA